MSLCSEHQVADPNCHRCRLELDLTINDDRIITCFNCNFVYYANSDICPKCQSTTIL